MTGHLIAEVCHVPTLVLEDRNDMDRRGRHTQVVRTSVFCVHCAPHSRKLGSSPPQ
jgi:hypothetical protein